jgi:hypothetical protein
MSKKSPAARRLLPAFFLLGAILLLSGCGLYGAVGGDDANIPGSLPFLLRGEWAYIQPGNAVPAERYLITDTAPDPTIEYGYGGGISPFDYGGTIVFVSNYNADSGVIIVKYAPGKKPSYPLYNDGDFGAVYYRNLTGDSVQLANAINLSDMSAPDTASQEEAVEKFTRMMRGSYVDWSAVQPQRRMGE